MDCWSWCVALREEAEDSSMKQMQAAVRAMKMERHLESQTVWHRRCLV
jgi:hypothetical protein